MKEIILIALAIDTATENSDAVHGQQPSARPKPTLQGRAGAHRAVPTG
jgi:hypothetical protein